MELAKEESKPQVINREQYAWRKYYKKEEKYGLNIYYYCAVVYEDNPYPYHYRTDDTSLKIGDKVVVPVGRENVEKIAEIVSVEQHWQSEPHIEDAEDEMIAILGSR